MRRWQSEISAWRGRDFACSFSRSIRSEAPHESAHAGTAHQWLVRSFSGYISVVEKSGFGSRCCISMPVSASLPMTLLAWRRAPLPRETLINKGEDDSQLQQSNLLSPGTGTRLQQSVQTCLNGARAQRLCRLQPHHSPAEHCLFHVIISILSQGHADHV
jgi:hypothetical protein